MPAFGRDKFLTCALIVLLALCWARPIVALNRDKSIDQYGHDVWTSQNGLPGEAVYEILRTTDGYLWLRTSAGLVRFDGVRFVLVDPVVGNKALNEPVEAICKSADGDLLVRTTSRTVIYKNGVFSDYRPPALLPDGVIRRLFETREHEVFVGSDDFIYLIQDSGARMLRRGTAWISAFLQDDKGKLWIAGSAALYTYRNRMLSPPWDITAIGAPNALAEDHEHNLWVGTLGGLYRMSRDGRALDPVAESVIRGPVNAILEDHEGNLWVGTSALGLLRLTGGQVFSFNSVDGLTDSKVLSLYEDREGSLWVGTSSGLDRFRDTKLSTFTTKEGLPSNEAKSAIETRDGSLYVFCDAGGLGRIKNGLVTPITNIYGLAGFYGHALFESKDGSLWLGTAGGLTRYKDGRFTVYRARGRLSKNFISAIDEDDESLIVTTSETLALRFKNRDVYPFTIQGRTTPLSTPGNYTFTIYRAPSGTLWFGTVQGLFKFAKGEPPDKARQSQIDFPVTSISDDQRGSLWLGGRISGLTRFRIRDGRITHYTQQDGLFDHYVTRVLFDDEGNLWVSTESGIYMANRKDLDDLADGRISTVRTIVYGTTDGMKTSEASDPSAQPGGSRTRDGRLWFTTRKGIVVVDPKHLMHNDLVPPVVIEGVVVDGDTLSPRHDLQIAPGKDKLEFHYTSLSLLVPARVRFKYQLEGYERNWVDAGTRRVAYYTHLPPGKYRFRVIASNDDGVWNSTGASVSFFLRPHFYQTGRFYVLCTLAAVLSAIGAQRVHTRRSRVRAEKLARVVDVRTKNLQEENAERKRVEAALETQRAFLRQVIDVSPNLIFVKDRAGRYTIVNQALADVYGMPVEQVLGKTDAEVNPHHAEIVGFRRDDLEVLDTLQEKVIPEETITDTQGRVRWVQTVKRPILDADGKATHILGAATDITDRTRAEAALEQQRRFLRQVIDTSPNFIFVKDREGRFTLVNQALAEAYSRTVEEIIGKTDSDISPKREEAEAFRRDDLEVLDTLQEKVIPEETNTDSQGRVRWFQVVKRPFISEDGTSVLLLGVAVDITARRRVEQALRESQQFLHAIIDSSRAVIYVRDLEGRYMLVNRRFEELFHMTRAAVVGKTDYDVFPKERAEMSRASDQKVLETGKPVELEDVALQDGYLHAYITVKGLLSDQAGKPYAVCGISTDITERKLLEDQLRQAHKIEAVGQLAGGIAHDFNSILTGSLGYSELMMRRLDVNDRLYPMAKSIRDASLRARELTRRLLAFSRKQILEPKALHLNAIISGMSDVFQLMIGAKVTCVRHLDSHLHVVKADPIEIEQVIMNLVTNASDAMPEGGTLTLCTSNMELKEDFFHHDETPNPGAWVVLEVSDTGCGMARETMSHIFEPFFTTKGPTKGSGLGLAMVYGFVNQSGGLIRVESELGKGTKFQIYLPRTKEQVLGGLPPTKAPEELGGTETILIVDDEGMVRQLLYESLADLGYTVLDARDGPEALRVAENYTEPIGLLLTDLVMPGMDGRELAQRHILLHPESKVLFISGYPGRTGDIDSGPDSRYAFLPKPFAPDSLVSLVRALLDRAPVARQKAAAAGV